MERLPQRNTQCILKCSAIEAISAYTVHVYCVTVYYSSRQFHWLL